jgi:hypothetical protein
VSARSSIDIIVIKRDLSYIEVIEGIDCGYNGLNGDDINEKGE